MTSLQKLICILLSVFIHVRSIPGYVVMKNKITFNFQCQCLQGWNIQGDAFLYQPTLDDNPTARGRGQPSNHAGSFWIGGVQNYTSLEGIPGTSGNDGLIGSMETQKFDLYAERINFLIGGGCSSGVGVALIIDNINVRNSTGLCTETMQRVQWDVKQYFGKTVSIRAFDNSTGVWGHINFDDFKFQN